MKTHSYSCPSNHNLLYQADSTFREVADALLTMMALLDGAPVPSIVMWTAPLRKEDLSLVAYHLACTSPHEPGRFPDGFSWRGSDCDGLMAIFCFDTECPFP